MPTAAVDRIFAAWDRRDSPGAALAILRDGNIVYQRGYGMADLDHGIPIGASTVFNIASLSKQFTVFLILLLAQAGLLDLDDDVRRHVPELPDFGKTITLRHLIHHTSGLREDWSLLGLAGWRSEDLITQRDVLGLIFRQKELNFAPGEQHLSLQQRLPAPGPDRAAHRRATFQGAGPGKAVRASGYERHPVR